MKTSQLFALMALSICTLARNYANAGCVSRPKLAGRASWSSLALLGITGRIPLSSRQVSIPNDG